MSAKENLFCKILENHPADSRLKICDDGIFQTLSSRMGTGGGQCANDNGGKYERHRKLYRAQAYTA